MKYSNYLSVFCAGLMTLSCSSPKTEYNIDSVASPKGTEIFQPDWDNIAQNYEFPQWYTDGKFGIFIHWGVYSVPAYGNEWYSRNMYIEGSNEFKHHVETWGKQTEFGYKDFIPMFTGEKFNADEWATLFKEAGAKYVVPVAEHHDGFAMYDSELNPWNSVKMGPKKDIIGSLKAAFEKQGLVFGVSSHRAENAWFFNGGMKFPSDVQDTTITLYGRRYADQAYTEDFAREWLTHTYELVDKYQPRLVYFDWTVNNPVLMPYFNRFLAYYYNNALDWGEGVVVNTKQGYPTNVQVWGQIVRDLVDIVSKNGNLLLNIGPKPDGTIPEEQKNILLSIGRWLKVNGEAIYGTHCWKKYGEGETESAKGSFSDNEATPYTATDIRFTTKGNDFYAISLGWSDKDIVIKSLTPDVIGDAEILGVSMLGSNEKIQWEKTAEGLKVSFPSVRPCEFAYSFKISFDKMVGKNLKSEAINEVLKHGA